MDFQQKQAQLDQQKWEDSIFAGEDTCGTYDFCKYCKRDEEQPCARAFYRAKEGRIPFAKMTVRRVMKTQGE